MKNLILMIGAFSIALNTLCGMLVTCYSTFNYLLTDVSLILSTVIIYLSSNSIMANSFKIGLTVFFFFTGLARCLCTAFASKSLISTLIIVSVGILFFEIVCYNVCLFLSTKSNRET